jgi:putative transposase
LRNGHCGKTDVPIEEVPMPRPPRIIDPNGRYHLIARGNNRATVFRDRGDFSRYLSLLAEVKARFRFLLHHYVLMPNHVHFSLAVNEADVSAAMHILQLKYAKYYALRWSHSGHVWQGRFKSLHIDSDAYQFACGNYIEMNPVRAGLVGNPGHWTHSSYGFYARGRKDVLVDIDPLYGELGKTEALRQRAYAKLIAKTRS